MPVIPSPVVPGRRFDLEREMKMETAYLGYRFVLFGLQFAARKVQET